jgi:hypothetical protein
MLHKTRQYQRMAVAPFNTSSVGDLFDKKADYPVVRFTLTQLLRGLLYLVFLGVCVEVSLQAFYYITAGDFLFRRVGIPIYAREPYAGHGNRPGLSFDHWTNEFRALYYINRAGFRVPRPNLEYSLAKPSDTYRVMVLDSSFAFGWGVDYELSLAGVLERLLQERDFAGGKKIEIINAGVPAMPEALQLTWFERVGKAYAPDLVIQLVNGSMAIPNVAEPSVAVDDDGYLVPLNTKAVWRWRARFKKLATVFYGWVLWTRLNTGSLARLGERGGGLGAGREMAPPTDFDPTRPKVREAMLVYNKLISIARETGARLLIVHFPLSYAIHREDESRWRHLGILNSRRQMAFDAAFVRYLNERQIPSIDITPQLQKFAQAGNRMYFWLDIHWTPAGSAAAAQAVADQLTGRP